MVTTKHTRYATAKLTMTKVLVTDRARSRSGAAHVPQSIQKLRLSHRSTWSTGFGSTPGRMRREVADGLSCNETKNAAGNRMSMEERHNGQWEGSRIMDTTKRRTGVSRSRPNLSCVSVSLPGTE